MKRTLAFLCTAAVAATTANAAVISTTTLTPEDINGLDTTTVSFSDGNVTLTPLVGGAPTTFNGNAARLGVDGVGTNNNAFNDPDTDPNNGNEETLQYDFATDVGLAQIEYDFSRADGPGDQDGVVITGFSFDPDVTISVADASLFAVYNAVEGSVRINVPGPLFGGVLTAINFNPNASVGQSLSMSVTDTTQGGAQLAIRSISYAVVPEPTALALSALVAAIAAGRQRRR